MVESEEISVLQELLVQFVSKLGDLVTREL